MRAVIVGPSQQTLAQLRWRNFLRKSPEFGEPGFVTFEGAEQHDLLGYELVVVCLAGEPLAAQAFIEQFRTQSSARLLAVGPASDSRMILRTMQIGADLFVDQDEQESVFATALTRLFPVLQSGLPTGRVYAVVSASGGCGVSTVAVNLAAALAKDHGKCALVDLHNSHGDLHSLLDLKAEFSIADACINEERFDRAMLEKMLVEHRTGIHLLAAPPEAGEERFLTTSGVERTIAMVRTLFKETVLDLGGYVHADEINAIRHAQQVLVVCRLDFASLRNTRRMLDFLANREVQPVRIKVLVNQVGRPHELPLLEAERALGMRIVTAIPDEPAFVNSASNVGLPVVAKHPECKVATAITGLLAFKPGSMDGISIDEEIAARGGIGKLMTRVGSWARQLGHSRPSGQTPDMRRTSHA